MRGPLESLVLLGAFSLCAAVAAPAALGAEACPNEQLRTGPSVELPDCRAYELVSPDSNHAHIDLGGASAEDGDAMIYQAVDAPDNAQAGEPLNNHVRAERNALTGWSGVSLVPPLLGPVTGYKSFETMAVSADFSSTVVQSTQDLSGGPVPKGFKMYVGHPGGTYQLLTPIGPPNYSSFSAGNADFSHIYFTPSAAQLPSDPIAGGNTYSWTQAGGLKLVGILPDGTAAPNGVGLAGSIIGSITTDANRALFLADGKLYVHIEGAPSVEVSATQRTIDPDPNPGPNLGVVAPFSQQVSAGITASGSTVIFVAHSELTNDANTGSSAGVATDAGADLYSYDLATGHLTDLTPDADPADAATGANVLTVLKASPDGSYIYFTATGHLASGAMPGQESLYVWHEGRIDFVADAEGLHVNFSEGERVPRSAVSRDGTRILFPTTTSLTGYDNRDPSTGQPHVELFEATFGAGVTCVSCREDGTPPIADSFIPSGASGLISDDGRRVFFASSDAVVPQASSGFKQVYEYENGKASLISWVGDTANAELNAASPSGDDVFFTGSDELVPSPNGGDSAVFDARVGGGFPVVSRRECLGEACRGLLSSPPALDAPSSSSLSAVASGASTAPATTTPSKPKPLTRAQRLAKALKACKSKRNTTKRVTCEKKARRTYGRRK
jgi:hypothetical protein